MSSSGTRPEKRKIKAHERSGKAIAETVAVRHVGSGETDREERAEHLRGGVGLNGLVTEKKFQIRETDYSVELGFRGIFRNTIRGQNLNVEAGQIFLLLPDGGKKNIYLSTEEPIGKKETFDALLKHAAENYPDAKEVLAGREYRRYKWDKEKNAIVVPDLPEWLEKGEKVPTEEMKAAVDHFVAKSGGTSFYNKKVVISGNFMEMSREEANEFLEMLGSSPKSSLSKTTDYVIADPNSTTSKVVKAKELGIPIVTPEEVFDEASNNTAAWQAEEYRRNRKGNRFAPSPNYRPGVLFDKWNGFSVERADDHEVAIAKAEKSVSCAHVWGPSQTHDGRSKVLGTGSVHTYRICTRCEQQETLNVQNYNWSGD